MLQHQIVQSPARLGLTGPGSPSVQNPTPPRHGHPTSSSSSQSQHQQIQQPPNLLPSTTVPAASSGSAAISSSALLSLLPPLPRAQALLQQMAVLTSKLFDVSPNRALWLSAFRGSLPSFLSSHSLPPPPPLENPNPSSTKEILSQFNSLQTQLFEAVTELQEILDLQDAKQKVAREVKSKDASLLAFANKLKEAERVLDMLVDDYSDYRKPKRGKIVSEEEEDDDMESSSSSSVTTTVSSQLKLKDILSYAHKISYTTFAPPEFGAGQAPLRGAFPPAPQDEQMRASQLYTFADLDIGLPKTVEKTEKKVEALIEPPPPPPPETVNLSAIQNLIPPNIAVPSGWKPGMPVELPKDLPLPPPGWKPGDPVVLPPLESFPAPRAQEQQHMRPPPGLHRPPDVIQVRAVQLDIMEDDSSEYSSSDASSDDED
uniref:Mediator of RNA polymerase II transcription subunit 4 n=1 Tax=Noccaea caerulescens TaxID=107243 RepID=A0A1J3CVF3_NOCCA